MTAKTELSAPKRRTRAEVQQLVAEFVSSGMRRSEFCQSRGLSFSTLDRHLKKQRWKRRRKPISSAGRLDFEGKLFGQWNAIDIPPRVMARVGVMIGSRGRVNLLRDHDEALVPLQVIPRGDAPWWEIRNSASCVHGQHVGTSVARGRSARSAGGILPRPGPAGGGRRLHLRGRSSHRLRRIRQSFPRAARDRHEARRRPADRLQLDARVLSRGRVLPRAR